MSESSWANWPIKKNTVHQVMERARELNRQCPEECRDFRIMTSPMRDGELILRWTTINIDDIERPVQCYRYECFKADGSPQYCSIHYSNVEEANRFFQTLVELYRQDFASDHLH